ncbi:ecotin [Myroides sp. WP-1]|uniref:ecotin n=1 Tax=Myroides sp. WP-1 TaxID=2759944 RepID=UPI0015F7B678|nr:ecotin family protein [Myroides sp. WP-1]MBB1140500.1 ecotin family protein [Myroides sp. WP-1]
MNKLIGFLGVFLSLTTASMAQKVDVSIFPKPEKGYKQMVIEVPHSKQDDNKKIEFTIGKMMEVDGCNSFGLMGKLEKKDLQGWGYDYYVFQSKGDVFSTQMACPDAPKRNLFVSSQPETTRYNGRMPIVIYVPEEFEVKFKIYTAGQDEYEAQEVRIKK